MRVILGGDDETHQATFFAGIRLFKYHVALLGALLVKFD